MPENVNISSLQAEDNVELISDNRKTMIEIKNVSMVFNMASEQLNSLKEYMIKLVKHELFFEGFTALDNISFEIKQGDVFGIVGTNGSGKSTLLKIIAGVLDPTEGSCTINGNIAPLIELGAGFDLELTARENIYLNGALLGYSKSYIDQHFDEIVSFAEIEKFLDMPMKNYSSGMVARIAFAIATVIVPEILIVDEVLSVGDFMFQKKCEDRINELIKEHGVTVLIVSHSNDQIERLCNKVIWIEKGHTRMLDDAYVVCRAYRSLGGRPGSKESEQRIFNALSFDVPSKAKKHHCIEGENQFESAFHAMREIWQGKRADIVILADSTTHVNAVLGNALAGALKAPLLLTRPDYTPSATMKLLHIFRPSHIIYLGIGPQTDNSIEELQTFPWNPTITAFGDDVDTLEFSKALYVYGQTEGLWGDTAVAIDFKDNLESLTFAPYVYRTGSPVFMTTGYNTYTDLNTLFKSLYANGCSKLIFVGGQTGNDPVNTAQACGLNVTEVVSSIEMDECLGITRYVADYFNQLRPDARHNLCVAPCSLGQWPELLSVGCYAGSSMSALMLEDPLNLDKIAQCLDYIDDRRNSIRSLVFFGSDSGLSSLDKDILAAELYTSTR